MITLKNVLLVNAVSSGFTGIALIAAPRAIASLLEISYPGAVLYVGLFLLAFAIGVYMVARKPVPTRATVETIVVADSLWVVASIVIVVLQFASVSFLGNFVIAAVAAWVALMAVLQYKGMKELPLAR